MAYAHIAHDCRVGSDTIFGPGATLGGHVTVEDYAQISAYSGVHQFCRVGRYAFIGGYSVVTKDALPFAKTVGNRAKVYGINSVGLVRRGFDTDRVRRLKRAYRYLLTAKVAPARALELIAADPSTASPDVEYLVQFVRTSARGVTLKRPTRRADDARRRPGRGVKLGLIAGNGRFPFLVLDAARSLGHAITVIAVKEEASPELEAAAAATARRRRPPGGARPPGTLPRSADRRRGDPCGDGRAGQAHQDLRGRPRSHLPGRARRACPRATPTP